MDISTIDVDKVKELLDSYWKKWEPYSQEELTRNYINIAKEDFLYRVNLYNDFIKRKDLSHFYPFRTILERLAKYERLLNLTPKEREDWLHCDTTAGWNKISKDSIENNDTTSVTINKTLKLLEKHFNIATRTSKMDMKSILDKSKIVQPKDTYDIYRTVSEYFHGSILSAAMRKYVNHKHITKEFSIIILEILEKLGEVEVESKTEGA
jgi:hypothetical protein